MENDFDEDGRDTELAARQVREALRRPPQNGEHVGFEAILVALTIDPAQLEDEFLKAPETYARFVEEYSLAEGAHLRAKFVHEQTEARLLIAWRVKLIRRAQLVQDRERKSEETRWKLSGDTRAKKQDIKLRLPTGAEVESAVRVDPEYEETRIAYILAEVESKRLKGFCDASRVKRDMLTNIGMRHNAELRVGPMDVANARHPAPPARSPGAFDDH